MVYKTLFNLNVLHAYFLDKGEEKYHAANANDELSEEDKREAERNYNIAHFLEIVPNVLTKKLVKNYRLLIRNHLKGIRVLTSSLRVNSKEGNTEVERFHPIINLSDDLVLTFYIRIADSYFENYTDVIEKNSPQLYYLSNNATSITNVFDANGSIETWDSFLLTEKESRRLVYDLEKEYQDQAQTPKRVSIANIETSVIDTIENKIENALPLDDEETEILESLNQSVASVKNNKIIGVVQLKISGDNNTNFTEDVATEDEETGNFDLMKQCLLKDTIDFQIYIENKKTFWRYNQPSENTIMVTNQKQPLTQNGKVEIGKTDVSPQPQGTIFFPNPSVESITKEQQNYYSEIFI